MKATEVIKKIEAIEKAMKRLANDAEFSDVYGHLLGYQRLLKKALEETEVKI